MNHVIQISWLDLLPAILPFLLILFIYHKWKLGKSELLGALLRMGLQLSAIGYILVWLFKENNPGIISAVLVFMLLTASFIAIRTVKTNRLQIFIYSLISTIFGAFSIYLSVMVLLLKIYPWENPRYAIPLAGMILASAMNGMSLAIERYFSERNSSNVSESNIKSHALRAALLPNTNTFLAVGLVAIPGMMTGQILAGVDPLMAARYQVLIMLSIFSSAGLSAALLLQLVERKLFKTK